MILPVQHLWLIPTLPLLAAAITALLPKGSRKIAAALAIAALTVSLLLALGALGTALAEPAAKHTANFAWFDLGTDAVRLGWLLDPLNAFMAVMVGFVGLLIFIFSLGYMREDTNAKQFFCYLSLFAAAMLGIVLSNSLLLLFISWELVGLASYLLIGFWFHKPAAAAAAKKAFITTRVGDLAFLLGLVWLYHATGSTLLFDDGRGVLEATALNTLASTIVCGGLAASTAVGLLLFGGAAGKSGQFPLHIWLPDAMEGPTPVSALIHAATMVAAGVFLMARVFPLMEVDQIASYNIPLSGPHALTVVAFIGAFTALLGACIAVAQNDLKRVLAFSTVSQLGYMMLAIGVGSWVAAIFHLLTHAFFKALLFLGAGSVIHAAHHEQDIRRMGGLRTKMKLTFLTFAVGMMALAGVPFLFSGFWSKEAILHGAHAWPVSQLPFWFALVAVVLTAFYMTRLVCEVFLGRPRSAAAEHAHESPAVMTVPLALLAVGAVVLGFLGTPAWPWLQAMLLGETEVHGHGLFGEGAGLMVLSIVLVGAGLALGWWLYGRKVRATVADRDPLEATAPKVFAALAARLGFDELYAATLYRLNDAVAALADWFDRRVWDGAVRGLAAFGRWCGVMHHDTDEQLINAGFNATSEKLRGTGRRYSRAQTGDTHGYLLTLALGFVVLVVVLVLGGAR